MQFTAFSRIGILDTKVKLPVVSERIEKNGTRFEK